MIYTALILLKISLDLAYANIIIVEYSHIDYYLNFDIYRYLSSWALYILSFLIVRKNFIYIKDYFLSTSIVFIIAPLTTIYGLDLNKDAKPLIYSLFSLAIIHSSYFFSNYFNKIKIPGAGGLSKTLKISVIFMLFLIGWYAFSGARINLDVTKVYEIRSDNRELTDIGLLSYLNGWIFKVFSVFCLAYCLTKKKLFSSIAVSSIFIYFFSVNAHKSVLLTPFLIIGTWIIFSKTSKFSNIIFGAFFLILISIIPYYLFNNIWLVAIFIDRLFFVPANLTFLYFDFFNENQFIYFSNSFLSSFMVYPYHLDLHKLIGEYKGHFPNESANNGYISSAYAQGGFFVIFIYSLIISTILLIVDSFIARNEISKLFALLIILIPLRDLISSADLLTTLLTGGLFIAFILIIFSRTKSN